MRKVLTIAGIVLLCMPTLFVGWLLAAARLSALDPLTLHLPMPLRSLVAEVAMKRVNPFRPSAAVDRVLRLDPQNVGALQHRCSAPDATQSVEARVALCQKAVGLDDAESVENGLGRAELSSNDPCAAEDAFRKATSLGTDLRFARADNYDAGLAGVRCGDFELARASFAAALFLDQKALGGAQNGGADRLLSLQKRIALDNGGLSIAYRGKQQDQLSQEACIAGFPDFKTVCRCDVDKDNHVVCSGH
jgi:hypothetical protein